MNDYKDISGYEGLYQVGRDGTVIACEKMQRYEHWRTRKELFRRVPAHLLSQQPINSGYLIVHLYKENKRTAYLVHQLVAKAFVEGDFSIDVNHLNGNKQDNRAANLEWISRKENHLHALNSGLVKAAKAVRDPQTGARYPAINAAARALRKSPRTIRRTFIREAACQH